MTSINYLLPLSSILLTAPGKHTVFLSCSHSLMLMPGSSVYGRWHPKGDILLSATIRQSREKSEMTSRRLHSAFWLPEKILHSPLVIPLTPSCAETLFILLPSSPMDTDLTTVHTWRGESDILCLHLMHISVS